MPGITAMAVDVLEADGSHPEKAGPCASCAESAEGPPLYRLTMCLTGSRLAKDRAADTVSKVMIPEALDYPDEFRRQPIESDRQTMEVDIACGGVLVCDGRFSDHADEAGARIQPTPPSRAALCRACPDLVLRARRRSCAVRRQRRVVRAEGIRSSFPTLDLAEIPMAARGSGSRRVFYLLDPIVQSCDRRSCALGIFFFVLGRSCG